MSLTLVGPAQPGTTNPESDYLSACVSLSTWNPVLHNITAADFATHSREYRFIDRHAQAAAGSPPTPEALLTKFPKFPYVASMNLAYAAGQLRRDSRMRAMSPLILRLAQAHGDGNLDAMSDMINRLRGCEETYDQMETATDDRFTWLSQAGYDDEDLEPVFATAGDRLNAALGGGFHPSTLNLVAAQTNVGKSMWLMQRSIEAVEAGHKVLMLALEMSPAECMARMRTMVCGADARFEPKDAVKKRMDEWFSTTDGDIAIYTKSADDATPAKVERMAASFDVVVVDYAGLMLTDAQESHSDSWNNAASIATGLQKVAHNTGKPVLSAVQLNKNAKPPLTASDIGQNLMNIAESIQYARHATTITTLFKMSRTVTLSTVEKNRNYGIVEGFFTRFKPANGDYREMTAQEAQHVIDNENEGSDYSA